MKKKILIIGATSGIGLEIARKFSALSACEFTLVARRLIELNKISMDLMARNPMSKVIICQADLSQTEMTDKLKYIVLKKYDYVILCQGVMAEQESMTIESLEHMNLINLMSYQRLIFFIFDAIKKYNHGHLVFLGSVAGDRGRKSNFWYGASKAYLEKLAQGMDHEIAFNRRKCFVSIVKPGPTLTKMTMHLSDSLSFARASDVAAEIVNGVLKRQFTIYSPSRWKLIMLIVKHIPRKIFHKLNI